MRSDGSTRALDDNGDLWWAVLGGGGGTYGIVTEFKYQLYDPPPNGVVRFTITFFILREGECSGVAAQVGSGAAREDNNKKSAGKTDLNSAGTTVHGGHQRLKSCAFLLQALKKFFLQLKNDLSNNWGGYLLVSSVLDGSQGDVRIYMLMFVSQRFKKASQ